MDCHGFNSATEGMENMTDAEAAGTAIGTGIGITFLVIIWVLVILYLVFFIFLLDPQLVKED